MSLPSINPAKLFQQTVVSMTTTVVGANPIGAAVMGGLAGANSLGQLQQLQKGLESLGGLLSNFLGGKKGAAAASDPAQGHGCFGGGMIPKEIMNNPLAEFAKALGLSGQGDGGGVAKHAKAPVVDGSDSGWKSLAGAVNNRTSGSRQVLDGSNPWNKTGEARDEAVLVSAAMQKTDNVQYDSDRKMFYQTGTNGAKTDLMSLADLKKAADGGGQINPNQGGWFDAAGKALEQASAKPAAPQQAPQQPSMKDIMAMLGDLIKQLTSLLSGGGANGSNSTGLQPAGSGTGTGGGTGRTTGTSSSSSTGGAASSSGGASGTSGTSGSGGGGMLDGAGSIDSKLAQGRKLSLSDNKEDNLKGQEMMQQAMRMFEMLSKLIEQMGQMIAKSIQAMH